MANRCPESRSCRARAARWSAAALLFVLTPVWCETADAAATFTLTTNQPTYQEGSLHVLSAAVTNTTDVSADVYIILQIPGGDVFSMVATGFTPGIAPLLSGVIVPAGFIFLTQPIFSVQLPALPVGTYTWFGAFTAAGTSTLVSDLAQASWVFTEAATSPVVWVPSFFGQKVHVRTGEVNTKAVTLSLNPNPGNPTPCNPNSVAVNGGKLYVVCNTPDAIRVYDAVAIKAAAPDAVLSTPAEKTITSADFNELIGIAFDAQNNLWVASFAANQIVQISAASLATANPTVTLRLPDSPSSPVALAFDSDGSLWVAGQFDTGIVLNFPADQLGQGAAAVPRFCISNNFACGLMNHATNLFKDVEGLALFNGKIWVANNGGNAPGRELVALRVANGALVVDTVFGSQAQGTGAVVCPGGLFATTQHLWVNDQGFNDPGTDCGASAADQGGDVGAVLRFTQSQLDNQTTDPTQIVRFTNITSRPGFGGIFVEGD